MPWSPANAPVSSFFSGIGGLDIGLAAGLSGRPLAPAFAAWRGCPWPQAPVRAVENDRHALAVLAARFPNAAPVADIRSADPWDAPSEVWCGGFPCQDISTAGRRAGIRGDRSGLFFDWARLVRGCRPRLVVMENVAALLARGLPEVLAELAESGYDADWDCVPAAAVGAPHRRDRIFIAAFPSGSGGPGLWGLRRSAPEIRREWADWWRAEPDVPRCFRLDALGGGADVPVRERLRRLGNAVVPPVAEALGRALIVNSAPLFGERPPFATLGRDGGWMERNGGFFGLGYIGRWPRAGSMRSGAASSREPSCPLRSAGGVPTPMAGDAAGLTRSDPAAAAACPWKSLTPHVALRTPTGSDGANEGTPYTLTRPLAMPIAADARGNQWQSVEAMERSSFSRLLTSEIAAAEFRKRFVPTPRAEADAIGNLRRSRRRMAESRFSPYLSNVVIDIETPPGDELPRILLNPEWVEWLMGFPRGWSDPGR